MLLLWVRCLPGGSGPLARLGSASQKSLTLVYEIEKLVPATNFPA